MSNLVIAVGGTGKSAALVYLKLAKFFGDPFDVMVMDMPFQREASIDQQLNEEGVQPGDFITPWSGGTAALGGATFSQILGLRDGHTAAPVAHALFADNELNTLVENGMNCRPIVGATVAMRKFWSLQPDPQLDQLRQRVAQYRNIFLVGSITGGTGSGVMPTLAKWLTEVCRVIVHGVIFLPYIDIGAGGGDGPSNAAMQANTYSTLSYLRETDPATNPDAPGPAPFQDYLVLGLPAGMEPDTSTIAGNHPLHMVAATYILYFDEFQRRNPEKLKGPFYLEIAAGGLRESDVQPTRGFTFAHAVYRQIWQQSVLEHISGQKPDQSWDIMTPPLTASFLSWKALRESVREMAVSYGGYPARNTIWNTMRGYFRNQAAANQRRLERFEAITARDERHLVYDVDWGWLRGQANGSLARARRAVRNISPPNINRDLSVTDSATEASSAINSRIFELLGQQANTIARGGSRQIERSGNSTVFLPPEVHNPEGPTDIVRSPLTNIDGLIARFAGVPGAVNMPDPQARRFQFAITLDQAVETFTQNSTQSTWDASDALSQFTALLEGLIYGTLKIRLYDLADFGFQSSPERRLLGVLVDDNDNIYGGTDPETLFFPAPEAWNGPNGVLRDLSNANAASRNTNSGQMARVLLKKFFDTFRSHNRPLWLKAIDGYLRLYQPPANVDGAQLRAGWKQVGPLKLRQPDGGIDDRYVPVYQPSFLKTACHALSGRFVRRDSEIYLEVQDQNSSRQVGAIFYPSAVRGLTEKLLGAGQITILTSHPLAQGNAPVTINYDELRNNCEALINQVNPSVSSVTANPFSYPDAVRLPFEHDGFLAEYFLSNNKINEGYGERFVNTYRGRGVAASPLESNGPGDLYVRDMNDVVYVEKCQQEHVKELSLLGQTLWMIFIGEAKEVIGRNIFNDRAGNVVLDFNGRRFVPAGQLVLQPPDQQMHAADLRGLAHFMTLPDVDRLFKEASQCWLNYLGLRPGPAPCARYPQEVAGRRWWKPTP